MDHVSSMRVFVCVAEKGSLIAAARELRLSATMVGKHLRFLEDHLGTRLLNRTTRRQSLTEIGALYLERAKHVLAELAELETGVQRLQQRPQGTLRVVCPVTYGVQCLTPALARFLEEHPAINVELTLDDRVRDLVEEGFDAAIRIGNLRDSSLIARRLSPYRTVLCAAPDYLARRGTPKKPADLRGHNCLGFAHWDHPRGWRLLKNGRSDTAPISGNLQVNHGFALRAAALAGLGIIMQPEVLLADDLAAKFLTRVLPDYTTPARPTHLVYVADQRMTPKLRRFVDFVVRYLGPQSRATR